MKNVIDKETAELEFERFCSAWEIDTDVADMDEEDRDSFNDQKRKIVKAICLGRLVFNENEELEYKLAYPEKVDCNSVTLTRPDGAAFMSMDKYKEKEGTHKTFSVLAMSMQKNPSFLSRLDAIDIKPLMAVMNIFLVS